MLRTSLQMQFLRMEKQKGDNGVQVLHNLHHTMFQCIVCLESYKIWVFENMPIILWSIIWPVYDVHVCHTFVWTVYDIMHPYITIDDSVFISCFLYGGQPGFG